MSCQRQCPIYSYHSLRSYRKTQKCALSTCGAECNRVAHLKTSMICGCCSLPSLLVSVYSENEYDIIRLVWESRWRQPRCRRRTLVYVFIVPPFVWHVLAGCSWLMHVHDSALLFVIYLHGAAVEFVYIWSGPAVEAFFMSLFTVGWDLPVLFSLFAHISEERRNTVAIPCERKSSNKWISMWEKEKQKHMYISKLPVTSVKSNLMIAAACIVRCLYHFKIQLPCGNGCCAFRAGPLCPHKIKYIWMRERARVFMCTNGRDSRGMQATLCCETRHAGVLSNRWNWMIMIEIVFYSTPLCLKHVKWNYSGWATTAETHSTRWVKMTAFIFYLTDQLCLYINWECLVNS